MTVQVHVSARVCAALTALTGIVLLTSLAPPASAASGCGADKSDYKGTFRASQNVYTLTFDGSGGVVADKGRYDYRGTFTMDESGVTIKHMRKADYDNPDVEVVIKVRSVSCYAGDSTVTAFGGVVESSYASTATFYKE
ncbi:hypothetical protein F3087_43925 [Nocardia colli]|uniref:Uncharacterized protein n=1 Tax=Nocardia colli TaxID=2545717 RepID=A0A5N0DLA1_9NOCA|nr:hypothetical protein [Nocardia colli]KAA8877456.1 hypothetical protein F3087_43925 [Nocardia colli]